MSKNTSDHGITPQLNQVLLSLLCCWSEQYSNKELFVLEVAVLFCVLLAGFLFFSFLICVFPHLSYQHWLFGCALDVQHIYSDDKL